MQKAIFATTIPHIISRLYLQKAHLESSIQSITSRFNDHETLQINQSNFLIFNPVFVRV